MIKRYVSTIALIAVFTVPLKAAHALTVPITQPTIIASNITQPTAPLPVNLDDMAVVPTLPQPTEQPLQSVALASFSYAPMDTYDNSYDVGQCTYGVASMKKNIPPDWGNAANWVSAAKLAGYTVSTDTPIVGSVGVSFNGYFGHVVVVTAVNGDGTIQIEEMNYDGYGDGLYRSRTADVSEFVYIYI